MTTHDGHNATRGSRPCPAAGLAYPVCPDLSLESCSGRGERVPWNFFVDVHGLGVLPKVVETREAATAVALERSLTSVFPRNDGRVSNVVCVPSKTCGCSVPDVSCQVFASREAQVTWRVVGAIKALRLLLLGLCAIRVDLLVVRSMALFARSLTFRFIHIHLVRVF